MGSLTFTVALTLAEAETVRCALQQRHRLLEATPLKLALVDAKNATMSCKYNLKTKAMKIAVKSASRLRN